MLCLPEIVEFMHKYHIEQGSHLQVLQNTHGSMVIGTDNARIALSREITDRIKVWAERKRSSLTEQIDPAEMKANNSEKMAAAVDLVRLAAAVRSQNFLQGKRGNYEAIWRLVQK